jgi:hypothetical protein
MLTCMDDLLDGRFSPENGMLLAAEVTRARARDRIEQWRQRRRRRQGRDRPDDRVRTVSSTANSSTTCVPTA